MLKITIDSIKGQKLAKPMDIFVKVNNPSVDSVNDRLICSFIQSDKKESEIMIDNFDWIGLNRQAVIQEKPELPKKTSDLLVKAETIIKDWITSLNLSQVKSIESV